METENIFVKQNNSGEIISLLKSYQWFDERWSNMNIEHKQLLGKMFDLHPSLGYHIVEVFKKNLNDKGDLPNDVWKLSSTEADLFLMLALPYDDSEMVLTDDTGLLDSSGNKILKGGKKSFKAQ